MSNELSILGNKKPEVSSTKIMKFDGVGFKDTTPMVLFDISGSMNTEDCPNHESRITVVNRIIKKMANLPVYAFSDVVRKVEFQKLEMPDNYVLCKEHQKQLYGGCKER